MYKNSKKGSIERRLLRAITAKSFKRNMIQTMCQKHLLNDITSGSIRMQVNNDIPKLIDGIPLTKTEQTRAKIHENVVCAVVVFILHKDHVTTTDWGERTFTLSNDHVVTLPRLCRKRSHLELWDSYNEMCNITESATRLGKRSFYYLVTDLTSSNSAMIKAVDFV